MENNKLFILLFIISVCINVFLLRPKNLTKKEIERNKGLETLDSYKIQTEYNYNTTLDALLCENDSLTAYQKKPIYRIIKVKEYEKDSITYINIPFKYQFSEWTNDTRK
jgi:hypothetical protein